MNNYVYIRTGLPELTPDWKESSRKLEDYLQEIRELCSKKDNKVIDLIEDGFDPEKIGVDFYREATKHKMAFIRDFFTFDLNVRNAKVRYLNHELQRDPDKDVISLQDPDDPDYGEWPDFEEAERLQAILTGKDILARERAIDDLYWEKIDALTVFHYLDFESILGVIVKMKIVGRWLKLDEKTGREMFRKLVDEVRGTFKGVDYKSDDK